MLNLIAQLVPLVVSIFSRIASERAAVEGKSEGVLLREALADVDETDAKLTTTLVKLMAKKQGDSRMVAAGGKLLSDLDRASELINQLRAQVKTQA